MDGARELAILKEDGTLIRDPSWRCIGDIMRSFHGFPGTRARDYGIVVDAETLVPLDQLMDPGATGKD